MSLFVKLERKDTIKWAISLICCLIVFLIPLNGFWSAPVRMYCVVTLFFLFAMAFELLDTLLVGILLPSCYLLFKLAPLSTVMSCWMQPTLYMCIGGFLLGAVLNECGVLKRLSYMLMSKVGSSYFSLLFCIYIVGVILTALTMGGAYYVTAAMCLGLIIALDIQNTRMAACIAMACMLGSVTAKCFTYCVTYYAIIAGMAPQIFTDGVNISMVQSIVANWPMFFVRLFSLWVFSKWYKADRPLESKEYFAEQLAALGPWRREEKMNLIILSGILLYMATTTLTGFDISYSLMIGAFLFFFPGINSSPKETLRHISFDMIFFIGACMSIGTVAAYLGFGQLISDYCLPLFAKTNNNTFAIFGVLFAIIFVLNFLMTPMAIWALVTTPLVNIGISLGMDPTAFIYALMHSAEAIILPYEYVPYLCVYAYGMLSMKDFAKMSAVRCVLYFAGFMLVLLPYWMLIGLL